MTSPSAARVGASSEAQPSVAHAPTGTNGHHVADEDPHPGPAAEAPHTNGHTVTPTAPTPATP
ncbi:hypothetical protein ABZ816_10895, partial [Actinosynnema sp. NPDC047251]